MNLENPVALSFIMQDDLYLLNKDRAAYEADIITEPIARVVSLTPAASYNYLGRNKKRFLVVVFYPSLEFMEPNHLMALESTLKRLESALDDVAVFNIAGYPGVSIKQLADFFNPQKLLLLGQQALPAGIGPVQLNKLQQLNDCRALFTFSFEEMMNSNENKKAFWEQMKQL